MPAQATGYIQPGTMGPVEISGAPVNGTNEVQTLTIGGTPTGGTFKVKFEGVTTGAISWNSNNTTLLAAIQAAFDAVYGTNAIVASAGTLTAGIGTILLTFGANRGVQTIGSLMTIASNALTGSAPTLAIALTTAGVTATGRGAAPGCVLLDSTNGTSYINTGTALAPVWTQSSNAASSQFIRTTLTAAQVKALNTTPIALVPAPGAGKVIHVTGIAFRLVFNSVAYTGANALEFRYTDGSGTKVTADIAAATLNAGSGTNYNFVAGIITAFAPVANAAIVVAVPTANPGAGDSLVDLTVFYRVITP